MRRSLPLLIILGIVVILLFWGCGSYNGLVQQDEVVKKSWNDVQSQYQRRADLIPNLVNTGKMQQMNITTLKWKDILVVKVRTRI